MAGEFQGDGVGGESLVVDGRAAEIPSRAHTEDRGVLWFMLIYGAFQSAVTFVGLLHQGIPVAPFLFAPVGIPTTRVIFRAYWDALDWCGLRLALVGFSLSLLACVYFLLCVFLLPSLVYGKPEPALTLVFTGVALTTPGLVLVGSVVGLGKIAWDQHRLIPCLHRLL